MRKGIILAGGYGSRLAPLTSAVSKQLLPVFDKPLIYYPLSTLILAGIREVLFITTPHDAASFKRLLGDGAKWGMSFEFAVQKEPRGLADAYLIARNFLNGAPSALILGDNIFYGHGLTQLLARAAQGEHATVFASLVKNPHQFGIVELNEDNTPISIFEKPEKPRSKLALTGLYFLNSDVCDFADAVVPSARGELEITSILEMYMNSNELQVEVLHRGFAWFDAGTHESLQHASEFIRTVQGRQGLLICSPEEIAYRQGYISRDQLALLANELLQSSYGHALAAIVEEET
ncbi:glucose-1-phosphate thymidylyltransferase RfbA [Alphaproteobacteria bacterium]|nr:glucose-1-phosphate thymidylyltransferase RfbA [Alphaproteobacteria bacterium]